MFSKISNEPFDLLIILNDPQFILDNSWKFSYGALNSFDRC